MFTSRIGYGIENRYINRYNKNKKHSTTPIFEARVDKGMVRFYDFNSKRMPTTMKLYLDSLQDKFSLTPIQAQKNAYVKLLEAKSIEDVQNLFPEEELFIYLEKAKNTDATIGLLGIYREFKDLYESVLKSGEDLTLYLLKKIFLEAKMLEEINSDLDKDLEDDIKTEFKRKYPNSDYVHSSTLKSLGIYNPDTAYLNSLKFTREGYSDEFGAKISEAQLKYWNSLSEEEKFEILSKRCEGRDNWWNALSYNEKLEYAAGIESEEELYKNYKKYVNSEKRRIRKETQEGALNEKDKIEAPKHKRIKVGDSKLQDRDVFVLWMKKNLEKFYARLSEADKDSVHLKRVRRLAVRWQEMTPDEKTELINKMRAGREPGRFIMIDAWNHSRVLIRELSDFLKSKQILKPVNVLYDSTEFSSFQSQIMTEFWTTHRELAEEFGKNIHRAYLRVEESIRRGQFQDLKQEILRDKAYRIKLLERERLQEEAEAKRVAEEARKLEEIKSSPNAYKYEFIDAYTKQQNSLGLLPKNYIDDVTNAMIEMYPEHIIKEYTEAIKAGTTIGDATYKEMTKCKLSPEFERSQRAMELALADEFSSKWSGTDVYQLSLAMLMPMLAARISKEKTNIINKNEKIDLKRIDYLYNEYRKDLSEKELDDIARNYFYLKENIDASEYEAVLKELKSYISTYGKSILPLFAVQSIKPVEQKAALNEKLLNLMPEKLKEKLDFEYRNAEDVLLSDKVNTINTLFAKRYNYLPDDARLAYLSELGPILMCQHDKGQTDIMDDYISRLQKKSNSRNAEENTQEGRLVNISKNTMLYPNKLKMLAIEQVIADELFNVCNDESVYALEFEVLCNLLEVIMSSKVDKNKSYVKINNMNNKMFILSKDAKVFNFKKAYSEYINELDVAQKELPAGEQLNAEDVLYTLNPDENRPLRDKYIIQRLKKYGFIINQ